MKFANYIHRIDIAQLWRGHKHIRWELRPDVNVLSGQNGAGKSTILRRLAQHLREVPTTGEFSLADDDLQGGVTIEFSPSDATSIRYDIIHPLAPSELDARLEETLQRYYLLPESCRPIQEMFLDIIDGLFRETEKAVDRTAEALTFVQYDEPLEWPLLSSGEKHILLILMLIVCEEGQPYVVFMDEPEFSLHFDWQKQLIQLVRRLNPHAQIILTTHSPAVIMDGWHDCVTEVSEITL